MVVGGSSSGSSGIGSGRSSSRTGFEINTHSLSFMVGHEKFQIKI